MQRRLTSSCTSWCVGNGEKTHRNEPKSLHGSVTCIAPLVSRQRKTQTVKMWW